MKSLLLTGCLFLLSGSLTSAQPPLKQTGWQSLFNGKTLTGWETYLDRPYAKDGQAEKTALLGLNNNPNHVFSVVTADGQPALRISSETFGGINTL